MKHAIPHFSDEPSVEAAYQELEDHRERTTYPACDFCGKPVQAGRDFRRVYGWVGGAGKDGFKRDGYGDEWAHKVCLDIHKTVGINQGGLF